VVTGMDHIDVLKSQRLSCGVNGSGRRRGCRPFDLEAEAAIATNDEQLEFRAPMGSPEEQFLRARAQAHHQFAGTTPSHDAPIFGWRFRSS
jgi:hypothetical protein